MDVCTHGIPPRGAAQREMSMRNPVVPAGMQRPGTDPGGTGAAFGPRQRIGGWGRATASVATVARPGDDTAWVRLVTAAGSRGLIARGAGSGYGDSAQNSGGLVGLTVPDTGPIDLDTGDGTVTVGAGVLLRDLMRHLVPLGWTLPVLPGTTEVSVGGAIAADVHGKNHPEAGAFSAHVAELTLLAPGPGQIRTSPQAQPDIFWATVGGLGLTGVIRGARLRVHPLDTAWMLSTDAVARDLATVLDLLTTAHGAGSQAVAWLDGHGRGAGTGAGVVSSARYATVADLSSKQRGDPLRYPPRRAVPVPSLPGRGLVRPATVAVANRAHLLAARRPGGTRLVPLASVLHPLDVVRGWPGLYGRNGLVQYQFVVPAGAEAVLADALVRPRAAGCPASLAVLKLLGAGDPAPLSFPSAGWTLALDFPAAAPGLAGVLDALDEQVAAAGGRVYLVKDSRLRPDLLTAMYPNLPRWREIRDRLDPDGVMASDLDRRLDLTGRRAANGRTR